MSDLVQRARRQAELHRACAADDRKPIPAVAVTLTHLCDEVERLRAESNVLCNNLSEVRRISDGIQDENERLQAENKQVRELLRAVVVYIDAPGQVRGEAYRDLVEVADKSKHLLEPTQP